MVNENRYTTQGLFLDKVKWKGQTKFQELNVSTGTVLAIHVWWSNQSLSSPYTSDDLINPCSPLHTWLCFLLSTSTFTLLATWYGPLSQNTVMRVENDILCDFILCFWAQPWKKSRFLVILDSNIYFYLVHAPFEK
jgi:hypothetical protein